jgi:hypothetical protein
MRKIITMIFIAFSFNIIAQPQSFTADSIDSEYGIEYYKRYNSFLGGEEQRMCNGSPCNEQIEDQYKNGKLLHKGYYTEGQLVTFKNYYPDGTIERDFKRVSPVKCKIAKYYPDGKPKSEVTYFNGNPIEWTDYYPNELPVLRTAGIILQKRPAPICSGTGEKAENALLQKRIL